MAHMSQEKKATLVPAAKAVLKKYGVKGSFSVRNHATLLCTIKAAPWDILQCAREIVTERVVREGRLPCNQIEQYLQVNCYHINSHFSGKSAEFLSELYSTMNALNFDDSDIQTDYHCVGYYVNIHIGAWNKPFEVAK